MSIILDAIQRKTKYEQNLIGQICLRSHLSLILIQSFFRQEVGASRRLQQCDQGSTADCSAHFDAGPPTCSGFPDAIHNPFCSPPWKDPPILTQLAAAISVTNYAAAPCSPRVADQSPPFEPHDVWPALATVDDPFHDDWPHWDLAPAKTLCGKANPWLIA